MTNPVGKRRKRRRSLLDPRYTPDEASVVEPAPLAGELPAVVPHITKCQRCNLPLLGEAFVMKLEGGETRQSLALCEPCSQSLNRWLRSPARSASFDTANREATDGNTTNRGRVSGRRRRRKKSSEIADSLISRRRSSFSKKLDQYFGGSGSGLIVWFAGFLLVGMGLIGLIFGLIYVATNIESQNQLH